MNNILNKSLIALCIMTSSVVPTYAGWGDWCISVIKKHCVNNGIEKDLSKNFFSSITNETKNFAIATFSPKNMYNFYHADQSEKASRLENLVPLAGNIIGAGLDSMKEVVSDHKNNVAKGFEKLFTIGKEMVKNEACNPWNRVGLAVTMFGAKGYVEETIDACVKSDDIKDLSGKAADVVENTVKGVLDFGANWCSNKFVSRKFEAKEDLVQDDWVLVNEVNEVNEADASSAKYTQNNDLGLSVMRNIQGMSVT